MENLGICFGNTDNIGVEKMLIFNKNSNKVRDNYDSQYKKSENESTKHSSKDSVVFNNKNCKSNSFSQLKNQIFDNYDEIFHKFTIKLIENSISESAYKNIMMEIIKDKVISEILKKLNLDKITNFFIHENLYIFKNENFEELMHNLKEKNENDKNKDNSYDALLNKKRVEKSPQLKLTNVLTVQEDIMLK